MPNHPSRTERLVRAAARNDPQAWDELVKEFSPVLRGVVRRFRLGSHQVEDVVQATWERLFARITTIENPAALPGWLVTTAQREAIRAVRASGRELPFDELPGRESTDTSSTADRAIVNERRAALRAAVGRLPGRQRTLADAILAETALGYAGIARRARDAAGEHRTDACALHRTSAPRSGAPARHGLSAGACAEAGGLVVWAQDMRRRISSPALVGRLRELEVVADLLAQARAGSPSLCIVAGEAGVGKTRLVRELERLATEGGMPCLRGQCVALAGGEFPFAPFVGILRQLGSDLLDLLPADAPVSQARAHAALFEVLRRAAAEQPTAIVIEDVHWADESDVRLPAVSDAQPRGRASGHRRDVPQRRAAARASGARARRRAEPRDPVVHLGLDRLTRAQTAEQLAAIAGRPVDEAELDEIHARAQGNPFLAEELWATRSLAIPATLGDTLLARVRTLPAETQRVLRLVAVFGRPVGHELVGSAAHDTDATIEALRRAVDEHVLMPTDGGRRLTFRHALVREALYAELLPGEREDVHRAVVAALQAGGASAGELAYHHLAAGRPAEALAASIAAGRDDARRAAYPEALHQFERALELWDTVEPADPALDRLDVYRDAAEAARLTGAYERAVEHCRMALQQSRCGARIPSARPASSSA